MLQYLRWMWREAPRSLRVEFLVTILVIELLALATMLVLTAPAPDAERSPDAMTETSQTR